MEIEMGLAVLLYSSPISMEMEATNMNDDIFFFYFLFLKVSSRN